MDGTLTRATPLARFEVGQTVWLRPPNFIDLWGCKGVVERVQGEEVWVREAGRPKGSERLFEEYMVSERPLKQLSQRAFALADDARTLEAIRPVLNGNNMIAGWLDHGTLSVLYAPPNVGKTPFAVDLALHIAAGRDWHGKKYHSGVGGGYALYIAAEGGQGIDNRLYANKVAYPDLYEAAMLDGGFRIITSAVDLFVEGEAEELASAISAVCPRSRFHRDRHIGARIR